MSSPGFVVYKPAAAPGSIAFDFTTGTLPGAITFTRASAGTYNSAGNVLTSAAANAARFNYVGGVSCLLIEPAATNLFLQSNNFTATWFTQNAAVLTAAATASPDGTTNGWSMSAGSGFGGVNQAIGSLASGNYTISCWAKAQSGTPNFVLMTDFGANDGGANLSTAWLRRVFTHAASGSVNPGIQNNTSSALVYIFGAQMEAGSVATSYIVTGAATATRAADAATFTIPGGVATLTYKFDDNSTQQVAVSPGAYTIPTNLNRPNIKTITSP